MIVCRARRPGLSSSRRAAESTGRLTVGLFESGLQVVAVREAGLAGNDVDPFARPGRGISRAQHQFAEPHQYTHGVAGFLGRPAVLGVEI